MKICVILPSHPSDSPGGAELQAKLLAEELVRRGHDLHYIAYRSGIRTKNIENGVQIHRLNGDTGHNTKKDIVSLIKKISPDFCYFRNIKDMALLAIVHFSCETQTIFNISHDAQCLPLFAGWPGKQDHTPIHTIYRRFHLAYRRGLLLVPDYLFIQTQQQADLLEMNRGLEGTITGNGHPIPEKIPKKEKPPVVLWLASIKEWKQPEIFVNIAEECRDLRCQFKIIGKPTNTTLAHKVNLRTESIPNIEYFGGCDIEESNRQIANATVFVNTSKQEGFPNTFLQSWLRETAVVSLNSDPDNLLSEHGLGLYANGCPELLVRNVRALIEDTEDRQMIIKHAREFAEHQFSVEALVDRIEQALLN